MMERTCPTCPATDNEWPAAEFGLDPDGRLCAACWTDTKKLRRPCSTKGCARRVLTTLAVMEPRCRPCRRRLRAFLDFTRARQIRAAREGRAKPMRRPCTGCGQRTESTNTCPAPLCLRCRNGNHTNQRAA